MRDRAGYAVGWRLWLAAVALTAWLSWPVLFSQHLEGYTFNLQSIARARLDGDIMGQDLLLPRLTEFIYYTRSGLVGVLQLAYAVFGDIGDYAFRVIMITSVIALLILSVQTARRLEGASGLAALVALVLAPGILESAVHFNDNIPAAAIACGAVAAVARRDGRARYLLAGALIAAAMLVRLDSVLLAPVVAGIAWVRHDRLVPIVVRGAFFAAGLLAAFIAGFLLLDATVVDALLAARGFFPGSDFLDKFKALAWFFGVPLVPIGIAGVIGGFRDYASSDAPVRRMIVFLVYPAFMVLAALKISTELRYVYPLLAPFIALHGARGVTAIMSGLKAGRPVARLAAFVTVLAMIAPPLVYVRDGPHSVTGRLWMPFFSWRWEQTIAENLRTVDALVAAAERTPRTLIVHTHFNDEFFVKERLLRAGYEVLDPVRVWPGCSGFSLYRKDRSLVAQLRNENQYGLVRATSTRFQALKLKQSLACPQLMDFERRYLTVFGPDIRRQSRDDQLDPELWGALLPRIEGEKRLSDAFSTASVLSLQPWRRESPAPGQEAHNWQGRFRAYPFPRSELTALRRAAESYYAKPAQAPVDPPVTLSEVAAATSARCRNDAREGLDAVTPACWR